MQEKGVSVFVVVLLSIALCVVVAIGAWKYGVLASDKEIEKREAEAANKYENVVVDRTLANEKIDTLKYILGYVVSDNTNIFKDRINNGEFIKNKDEEFKYVWMLDVMLNKNIVIFNINQYGKEETGITSIDVNDFIVSYKKALGVTYLFDQNSLPEGFYYNEEDNRIYGSTPTSWNVGNIIMKFSKLTKKDSVYTLTINVLNINYDEENMEQDILDKRLEDYQVISKYDSFDYDSDYIMYKLNISFVKTDGNYAVKSIVATE